MNQVYITLVTYEKMVNKSESKQISTLYNHSYIYIYLMPMFKPYGLLNHQLFTTFENLPGTTPDLMIFPGSSCGAVLDISLWILLDRGVGQPPCNPNSYVNLCHIYISSLIMLIYQRIIYIYVYYIYTAWWLTYPSEK